MHHNEQDFISSILKNAQRLLIISLIIIVGFAFLMLDMANVLPKVFSDSDNKIADITQPDAKAKNDFWSPPDISTIKDDAKKELVLKGKDLIQNTAKYFGPKGSVAHTSNGMNCQNCHLNAGTSIFGNNYGSVASTYPKLRSRSGTFETIPKRINDCFERSLNGSGLDTLSNEMLAMVSYMQFIGSGVEHGKKAKGSGLKTIPFLDRAVDPEKGEKIYAAKCASCHMPNGEGQLTQEGNSYTYPPLWGPNSYNDAAGLYRITNFAKYVKFNMPLGSTHESPQLTDEEAWDVAGFVNTRQRPQKRFPKDWPDISKKPIDHPFGPYADAFPEKQHKLGPFGPIQEYYANKSQK